VNRGPERIQMRNSNKKKEKKMKDDTSLPNEEENQSREDKHRAVLE